MTIVLAPHALAAMVCEIAENTEPGPAVFRRGPVGGVGSARGPISSRGGTPTCCCQQNLVCHLAVYRREFGDGAGRVAAGDFDGSQDYDLALRVGRRD